MARNGRGWWGWLAAMGLLLGSSPLLEGCNDGGNAPGSGDASTGSLDAASPGRRDAGPLDANLGPCPNAMRPPVSPERLPECDLCEGARCVPNAFVPESARDLLAPCDENNKCVPVRFIETNGEILLASCRSVGGVEGRCISRCIPQVASQADLLPEEGCNPGEECAPCYDPTTGEPTGVCTLGCDPGPSEPPAMFDECCGGAGSCVPSALVPPEQLSQLGRDSCTDEATLCAPRDLIAPGSRPTRCSSLAGAEGRCLPACLPSVAVQASRLPRDICEETHLCAPCYDPTTGESTGACELNDDMPTEPPVTFDQCCGGIGSCVPSSLVPEDQRGQLGTDTCTDAGSLCAPNSLIDGDAPATCRSISNAEGRCLPACLPSIADQADRLPQATCPDAHLCAPCYDPITGESTGACDLGDDMPTEPPVTFDDCCGGIGSCVPSSLVPESQRSQLGVDSCTADGALCAPNSLIDGDVPATCRSISNAEGRCLPACLPSVAAQADRLPQATCPANHLCAPCYDPISGESSGACGLNGDMPTEPAFTFPNCCGGIGSCVPSSLVPESQRAQLGTDTCTGAGNLCAPDEFIDSSFQPTTCRSIADAEGRCLPRCLPSVATQADRLPQANCAATHLCAPCYDPITGDSTGACEVNGDMPTEPAYEFPNCCMLGQTGRGRCVPPDVVPEDRRGALKQDTCATEQLCVPNPFLTNPSYSFPSCDAGLLFGPGACVPDCIVDGFQGVFLGQGTCAAGEKCAPCNLFGNPTGACN